MDTGFMGSVTMAFYHARRNESPGSGFAFSILLDSASDLRNYRFRPFKMVVIHVSLPNDHDRYPLYRSFYVIKQSANARRF